MNSINRREWLARSLWLTGGVLAGVYGSRVLPESEKTIAEAAVLNVSPKTDTALSLKAFQAKVRTARSGGRALPDDLTNLGGLNRFAGFTIGDDGDVVLFGQRDPLYPKTHIDDLMVALRSAWRVDDTYNQAVGVSIDPDMARSDGDPWSIQSVRVLGMPRCRMSKRQLDLDYELKLAGAGLRKIPGVRSSFEVRQSENEPCQGTAQGASEVTNRFWFCARIPDAPRFEADDRTVTIVTPVHVRVLTERRLFGPGKSESAGSSDPIAERFAQEVSALLVAEENPRAEYLALRTDFRLIELGALLKTREIPMDLAYLLHDHEPGAVEVPRFVAGVSRKETSEISCNGVITESAGRIQNLTEIHQLTASYRGGVDAHVETPREHFVAKPSEAFAPVIEKVRRSRPDADAWIWSIGAA